MNGEGVTILMLLLVLLASWGVAVYKLEEISGRLEVAIRHSKNQAAELTREKGSAVYALAQRDAAWLELQAQTGKLSTGPVQRSELVDRLVIQEHDRTEAAAGAYFRLKDSLVTALSLKPTGAGPLFSASKDKVADRALQFMFTSLAELDTGEIERWLDEHPGQLEKLS